MKAAAIFGAVLLAGCASSSHEPSGPASLQVVPPSYYSTKPPAPMRTRRPGRAEHVEHEAPRAAERAPRPAQAPEPTAEPTTVPFPADIRDQAEKIAKGARELQQRSIRKPPPANP